MWHIGQRVVCVKTSEYHYKRSMSPCIKGAVYTIRDIIEYGGVVGLKFDELINRKQNTLIGFLECGYYDSLFRPIDEKRIDIFRAMLKSKEKEKVE